MNELPSPSLQIHDQRNLDPHNALEKVVRLDKKHTNFDYFDKDKSCQFKVSYPSPHFDAPPGEHLLKGFWRHITNYYFKRIDQSQLERLDYMQSLLEQTSTSGCNSLQIMFAGDVRFSGNTEFWYTIQRLFSDEFRNRYKNSFVDSLDCRNWLEELFLTWEVMEKGLNQTGNKANNRKGGIEKDKSKIKAKKRNDLMNGHAAQSFDISHINSCFTSVQNLNRIDNPQRKQQLLLKESKQLQRYLPSQEQLEDQVEEEIRQLELQLSTQCSANRFLLNQLKERVKRQLTTEEVYIVNTGEDNGSDALGIMDLSEPFTIDQEQHKLFQTKRKLLKIQDIDITKQYIEHCIKNLQKKQIAESISKITKIEKYSQSFGSQSHRQSQNQADYKFTIQFETGMNLKPLIMTEKQMVQLNNLREYSLFKFYNTSLKTPYSFISQNFLGFRQIYQNRNRPCQLKQKDILGLMKSGGKGEGENQQQHSKAIKQMQNSFDICHHCKLLYPDTNLVKCQYSSNRMGAPITPSSYFDPYAWQIIKHQQPKATQRHMGKKRNCYISYKKTSEEYTCQRKFCRFCLKQSYQEGLDKNGLCPFCQGICFCTRCARHDMVIRLKSMFLYLGGNVKELQNQSFIEKIAHWGDESHLSHSQSSNSRNVSRSKIRSQKRSTTSNPTKMNEKMRNIRFQLQDLRILCDLVKRRQKQRQKLIQTRCESFRKKVSLISQSIDFQSLNDSSINMLIQEQEKKERIKQKMKKKLKRMIN